MKGGLENHEMDGNKNGLHPDQGTADHSTPLCFSPFYQSFTLNARNLLVATPGKCQKKQLFMPFKIFQIYHNHECVCLPGFICKPGGGKEGIQRKDGGKVYVAD